MPPNYGTCETESELTTKFFESNSWSPLASIQDKVSCFPKRYIFSLLAFTACCLAVSYNVNLSITIVSMVYHQHSTTSNLSTLVLNEINFIEIQNATELVPGAFKLNWNAHTEGIALGAVYYGQLVSFIPGGRMAELYGGKRMLISCTLLAAIATLLSPVAAMWSPYTFIVARILVGIGTGPIIPIVFYMLARWIPEQERSFHASFILSGYGVGSFLALILSGGICSTTFLGGWPAVFYTGALFGVIWCFLCFYLMTETPDLHPNITKNELSYIRDGFGAHRRDKIPNIPWKKMALSIPLWALAIGFFGQFWLLGFFSTVHALYMGTILKLPIAQNGILSCLPHLLRAITTCLASYPVDLMLKKNIVSVGFIRKGATVLNTIVSCGAFLGITYVGKNVTATTILFALAGILGEFVTFGVCLACIDIAPNLSGTVSGILNILGVFPFFIIPSLVGWLTNYENSIEKWRRVFYATIYIVSISTGIFVAFGDLRPQPWGTLQNKKPNNEKMESSEQ